MVSDNSNVPPQVLKEEACFRIQLTNGSHFESVKSYLTTQGNWLTEANMRLVFDFICDCKSELFKHVVNNRQANESLAGKNVLNTLIY